MPEQEYAELDVRLIPPRAKHPMIFGTFRAIQPGQAFVLVNDHDPRPLRHVFESEYAGKFGWEYLEQGPTVWKVLISKVGEGKRESKDGRPRSRWGSHGPLTGSERLHGAGPSNG